MQCPVCKESQLVMSERQGIEIDYCPDCRGVWLDRGELDKIIEKSAVIQQTERPSAPRYEEPARRDEHRHHSGHDNRGHYSSQKPYKKKSFLSELFD
ncbi:zf-TFIIB domain-containing protein [Rahnella laticis]|uniref:TFIIB-type zinc ribbon-containing protein n=1 Tax=Rahnella laticis TaxID=2787622 RepID=UPI0018A26437|nr:zf-TFIIB domain-containing protein [Rahnella laticis]MBF7995490.1 zf-TFIIB domain-containing protein [Rahnella laticis]